MSFLQYANDFASDDLLHIEPIDRELTPVENELVRRAHICIRTIKHQRDNFDRISLGYVEEYLHDTKEVSSIMETVYNGDVPDILPLTLASDLYDVDYSGFNDLTSDQQKIIKTLAMYICISAKDTITKIIKEEH